MPSERHLLCPPPSLEGAESVGLQRFPNPNGRMMESAGGCAFADETLATQSLKTSTGTLPELRRLIEGLISMSLAMAGKS